MRVGERLYGVLGLGFEGPHHFDVDEREFLRAVAAHCAQALERARLYQAAQRDRGEAERAEAEQRFLSEASAALAGSLDVRETLAAVARLSVGVLGELVVVDGEQLDPATPLAVAATQPHRETLLREIRRRWPLAEDDTIVRALRT